MSYHRKSKHKDSTSKGVHTGFEVKGPNPFAAHVTHTDGPGCWMDVPATVQQPKEPQPPTEAQPMRMHHRMAVPYKRG